MPHSTHSDRQHQLCEGFAVEKKHSIQNSDVRKLCMHLQIRVCVCVIISVTIGTSDPPAFSTSMGFGSGCSTGQPSTCVRTKGFSEATISPFPCGSTAAYFGTDFPFRTLLFFTSYFFSWPNNGVKTLLLEQFSQRKTNKQQNKTVTVTAQHHTVLFVLSETMNHGLQ